VNRAGAQHWLLLLLGVSLALIGVVSIWSAQLTSAGGGTAAERQLIFLGIGILAYLLISLVPLRWLLRTIIGGWIFALVALIAVLIFGVENFGSRRWIDLGPLHWQPSEFAKLILILGGAAWLPALSRLFDDRIVTVLIGLIFLPHLMLVLIEPDLGTTLSMAAILLAQIVGGPLSLRKVGPLLLAVFVILPLAGYPMLHDYQRARLTSFLSPEADLQGAGYQVAQSKIAIGSGGITGQGLGQGTQNRLNFIPGQHTDFIFTVIGEEGGFIGALALLLMYGLLFGYLLFLSVTVGDISASLVIIGVITMLGIQTLVNLAMTMGLAPVTGIPLPFMSYGGSSLLHSFMALGLVNAAVKSAHDRDDYAAGL